MVEDTRLEQATSTLQELRSTYDELIPHGVPGGSRTPKAFATRLQRAALANGHADT